MVATGDSLEHQPLLQNERDAEAGGDSTSRQDVSRNGVEETPPRQEREYTWVTIMMLASTWIGVLLAAVDSSIMATLTGPISQSFDSFQLMPWFINAFLASICAVTPLSGKLSDIYGRRNCLLVANFLFLLGNLICGMSTQSWHFLLGRVVGGLGGGCINSISTFIISDVIPLRARGLWQGVANISYSVGFATGGLIGGVIADHFGWRWAFLFQPVPLGFSMFMMAILVPRNLPESSSTDIHHVDFLGMTTLTTALVLLMWGAISGGNTLPWSSPAVYVPLALSPVCLVIFGLVELHIAKEPVIPIRLLALRTVLAANLGSMFSAMGYSITIYYVPLFLEVRGLAPTQAGVRLGVNGLGSFLGSFAVGYLMNLTGKYYLLGIACNLATISSISVILVSMREIALGWGLFATMAVYGAGSGANISVLLIALISAADHRHHAVLTSALYAFRTSGHTLGITIAGALFENIFRQELWDRFGHEEHARKYIEIIRSHLGEVEGIPESWKQGVYDSYAAAFQSIWILVLVVIVLCAIAAASLRENKLHTKLDRSS